MMKMGSHEEERMCVCLCVKCVCVCVPAFVSELLPCVMEQFMSPSSGSPWHVLLQPEGTNLTK